MRGPELLNLMTVRAMATTTWTHGPAKSVPTFDTLNPATSEVIATFPVCGSREIQAAVDRSHQAAAWWTGLPAKDRRIRLLAWKSHITRYIARLAELVHTETGKPLADAQLEILLAIVHIDWAAKNAHKVLRPRRVRSGLIAINQAATLEYQPLGVVGIIGPWNYPVFTPMGSIAYALAAGNAVIFKPSEFTPAVGGWLVSSFAEVVPEQPVLQLVTGAGETGDILARSNVNKIAFTGSAGTARKVMAACAENLTPMVAECGGKDAFIVGDDADLDAAADAAAWGALSNAGQTCVGVEADYGPMTMPGQIEIIEKHIADALARGGRPVVGGMASVRRPFVGPVILADVPEESRAVTDETFGPTVTVTKVADLAEGVRLANGGRYGLGATVFAGKKKGAMAAARALRSGMTAINAVIAYASVPALPFGGSGDSGFGRIHGADGLREFSRPKAITRQHGLREFSRPKAITRQRMKPLVNLTSFDRTGEDMKKILGLVTLLHGKRYKK